RLLAAAQAAGRVDLLDTVEFRQILFQLVGRRAREAQQVPAGAQPVLCDRAQYFFFEPGAHTRQHAQFFAFAELLELVHGRDSVVFEDQRDTFRSEPLDLEELERGRWELLEQQVAAPAGT